MQKSANLISSIKIWLPGLSKISDSLNRSCKKKSIQVVHSPIIQVEQIHQSDIVAFINWADILVFSSKQGVKYFFDQLQNYDVEVLIFKKNKFIVAIGEATEKSILNRDLEVGFKPNDFSSKGLIVEIEKNIGFWQDKKVLLVGAKEPRLELSQFLTQSGIDYKMLPVYETAVVKKIGTEVADLMHNKSIDWVIFSSPSTVRGFKQYFGNATIKVASIGKTTSKELFDNDFLIDFESQSSMIDDIIKEIAKLEGIKL